MNSNGPSETKLSETELKFANELHPGHKLDLSDGKYWSTIRQQMRIVAYHEAGHAVAKAFVQLEFSHITHISIIPDEQFVGRVRVERPYAETTLKHQPPHVIRTKGKQLLLSLLAGRGAAYRVDDPEKREEILDDWTEDWEDETSDLYRARSIARLMSKPGRSLYSVMVQAEKWTNEMLDMPPVWQAVEDIASALILRGVIEDNDELFGFVENMPLGMELSKWKRRLYPSKKEHNKEFNRKA